MKNIEKTYSAIMDFFCNCSEAELVAMHNVWADECGNFDDRIMNADELYEYVVLLAPEEAFNLGRYSTQFNHANEYCYLDGYGHLVSIPWVHPEAKHCPIDFDQLAEYVLEYDNPLEHAELKGLLDELADEYEMEE